MRNVQCFVYFILLFFFRSNRDLLFDFYGVLLVCNLCHIGVRTMDISRRKAVISNTK